MAVDPDQLQSDESMRETARHIRQVQTYLSEITHRLTERGIEHDASKWGPEEWPYFKRAVNLKNIKYGSPEYKQSLESLRPAIIHHQANNRHHPEYFGGGITDMSLIDLVEMLADWKAATQRNVGGDILQSIDINTSKFNIPEVLIKILKNTVYDLGWVATKGGTP